MSAQHRQQQAIALARLVPARHQLGQIRPVLEEPRQPVPQPRQLAVQMLFQHMHREQRNQADDRANAHRHARAVGELQHVVEELVAFIPEAGVTRIAATDRLGDVQEMLEELHADIDEHVIRHRQFQRDAHQVERIRGHPCGAIRLVDTAARGQRRRAVEDADVVQPEETALKNVAAVGVLAVHPPREVQQQLMEHELQEVAIRLARNRSIDFINAPCRPCVNRRVGVAERPFVGRQLPVRMLVAILHQQQQLFLRECRIDQRERGRVKREIPRRVPRVFPLVRHRDNVRIAQMPPVGVAATLAAGRRGRLQRIAVHPASDVEEVILFRPQHARQRLTLDEPLVGVIHFVLQARIKGISFGDPAGEQRVDIERLPLTVCLRRRAPAQGHYRAAIRTKLQMYMRGGARAGIAADRALFTVHNVVVEAVLERSRAFRVEQAPDIGVVLAE